MKVGDWVTYVPWGGPIQKGRVKSVRDRDHAFVVYNCDDDWDNYQDYTAALTRRNDLVMGDRTK